MVQTYMVGVVFCMGLIAGLVLSFLTSNYNITSTGGGDPSQTKWNSRRILDTVWNTGTDSNKTGLVKHRPPLSHQEVDQLDRESSIKTPVNFTDQHSHHDDDHMARELFDKVLVLCWVMTGASNHRSKADHVAATWGKRCNKLLFMSDADDDKLPVVKFNVQKGRDHLTAKTMQAFDYTAEKYLDQFDWFMKVDDDSYVIVENLRYFLSSEDKTKPVYFGHHFKTIVKQGYFSGGGGYVLSKEALRRFGSRSKNACAKDWGAEDVELGRCMEKLGVKAGDSRDKMDRSRFHCFDPETFIHGGFPKWFYQYDKYGAKKGIESISDYAITFHYVSVNKMYNLEFYIYHLRPYGITSGLQELNKPHKPKGSKEVTKAPPPGRTRNTTASVPANTDSPPTS